MCDAELKKYATILAGWAKDLPLKKVYVFGSRVRGDSTDQSDIDVAIEFDKNASEETMLKWIKENESDFASLKKLLSCRLSLHADKDDAVWPFLFESSNNPVFLIGKVACVLTPPKTT